MFGTFRHEKSQSGHDLSVLEPITSPFERSSYKISRIACVYCRFKKVKCTGEEQGCQRCPDKQLRCSYTTPARSNSESTQRQIPRLNQNTKRTNGGVTGLDNDIPPPDDVSTRPIQIEANIDLENIMATSSLLFPDYDLANASISQGNECAYSNLTYSYSDAFPTIETVNLTPAQTLDTEDLDSHEPNNISPDDGALEAFSKPNTPTCLCSELLNVFEIVQLGQNPAQAKDFLKNHSGDARESRRISLGGHSEDFPFQKDALKSLEK
ncbi:hypothetical protein CC80DRAFT_570319 [Byssothecium circinans]|uniref:Zn(2)-C6 fungal-type domain-containing protein n=1 Tax=Byssothecium circinans TaxID=147558 RepID=A0A6A5UB71_9PLEO|nr:hypothetical protein CC80DRAFT_570319 [Byssothecium circinans]